MPAVSPGERVCPRIDLAIVEKITVDIPRLKISQRSLHDDVRQKRRQGVGRRHADGGGCWQAGDHWVGSIVGESHARFIGHVGCQYRMELYAADDVRVVED